MMISNNHTSNKRRRPETHRRHSTMKTAISMILLLSLATGSEAFATLSMSSSSYKPPVKSSVGTIGSSRSRRSQSTSTKRSQQYATAAAYAPTSQPSRPTSFQKRMRGMLGTDQRKAPKQKVLPSNLFEVNTLEEYRRIVGEESDKIVAVRFFAKWCKACQAVQPFYYRLANQFPNVIFVDVPATEKNANLHQGLGVPSLPYGHIYHPSGGLVEESRMTKKHISSFARKVQTYVQGSCELQGLGDCSDPNNRNSDEESST